MSKGRKKIHGDGQPKNKYFYIYRIYHSIKQRCYNKKNPAYKDYGGRGISMYKLWKEDYLSFKEYILNNLGERQNGMTLDRINNDSNYEPINLRWITRIEQNRNKRKKYEK